MAIDTAKWDDQRESTKNLRDWWFSRYVYYLQKINDLSLFSSETLVDKAEDFCVNKADWMLGESKDKWIDCFKKENNLQLIEKDTFCSKPPF